MALLPIVRKELRRRRMSTALWACTVALVLLGVSAIVPRSWTSSAIVELAADPTARDELAARLRALISEAAGGDVTVLPLDGSRLRLRYSAADPQQALEALNGVLARVVRSELDLLHERYATEERALVAQVAEASTRVDALSASLASERNRLPEGGESALGARIGQLQGERDALALDLRASAELRKRLETRVADLDREIAGIEGTVPDAADPARLRADQELKPQRTAATARLATLRDEIAVKERRRREIDALLQGASAQTAALQQGSEALRELQRQYDDAAALHRQMQLQLQAVRNDLALKVTVSALPFRVSGQPSLPDSPDGVPAWTWVLAALCAGVLVAALRLCAAVLVDDRVRLPEQIVVDAEVPVLAVIAEHRLDRAAGRVRWPVMGAVSLAALLVVAVLAFLVRFG